MATHTKEQRVVDISAIRSDCPMLRRRIHEQPFVYLAPIPNKLEAGTKAIAEIIASGPSGTPKARILRRKLPLTGAVGCVFFVLQHALGVLPLCR